MAKKFGALEGMTLKDLMSDNGFIMETDDCSEELDSEFYPYNPNVNLTNDEIIRLLNMGDCDDYGKGDGIDNGEAMMPWSTSFEKIKAKAQDVTNDGMIMKLIRKKGVGELLSPNCLATVHYAAYIEYQDEPFDSSIRRGAPARLRVTPGEILPGLQLGLLTMRKHETAWFVVHHDYAYKEFGCLPLVPPNSEILFMVKVLDFIDETSENFANLSVEDRKQFKNIKIHANSLIKTAAESFRLNNTKQAIREYSRAANMLEYAKLDDDKEEAEMKKMLSRAYGNLAICFNKEDKPRQACKACLNVPNPTAKTNFHHGRALLKMGEFKKALEELHFSLEQEPDNKSVMKEIKLANTLQRKYVEEENRLWQKFLKLRNDEKGTANEYSAIAREFCESFAKNEVILREPMPKGLTPIEDKFLRQEAALLGLTVIEQVRYGQDNFYLAKPRYGTTGGCNEKQQNFRSTVLGDE